YAGMCCSCGSVATDQTADRDLWRCLPAARPRGGVGEGRSVPTRERLRAQTVRKHAEQQGYPDDRYRPVGLGVELLEGKHREDDRGETARPEPADERDGPRWQPG